MVAGEVGAARLRPLPGREDAGGATGPPPPSAPSTGGHTPVARDEDCPRPEPPRRGRDAHAGTPPLQTEANTDYSSRFFRFLFVWFPIHGISPIYVWFSMELDFSDFCSGISVRLISLVGRFPISLELSGFCSISEIAHFCSIFHASRLLTRRPSAYLKPVRGFFCRVTRVVWWPEIVVLERGNWKSILQPADCSLSLFETVRRVLAGAKATAAAAMDDVATCCVCLLAGFLFLAFFLGAGSSRQSSRAPGRPNGNKNGDDDQVTALRRRVHPPEPAGAWPVVGHLPLLGASKEATARTLGRMADQYGPVFMLRLGAHRTLVISCPEAARDCFTTCDRNFASRPRGAGGKYLFYDHSALPLAPYGPRWREMKKMAAVELLSPARLEKLRHVRATEVATRIGELHRRLCEDGGGGRNKLVDMGEWFMDTTFNVITRMVVGKRNLGGGGDGGGGEEEKEQMRRFRKALDELAYLMGMFVPSDGVPWLEWLDLRGYISAMKRTSKVLDAVLVTWIDEHRQRKKKTKKGDNKSDDAEGEQLDFVDVMLSSLPGVDLAGLDLDIAIKATVLAMISGGRDTSAVTMTWAVALLLNHRPVLDKLRREVDQHVGHTRNVEERDIQKLTYLHAVVKETMRLYPAGPLSVPHEATADCLVGGYHVPARTRLLTNLWKLHRNPRVWGPDPEEFRPERFLTGGEAAGVDVRGQQFEYLPFGSGRRMCPGISLALPVMHLTLARLVHGFELETPAAAAAGGTAPAVDMGEGLGLVLTKAAPLEILITPRLSPHLYHHY